MILMTCLLFYEAVRVVILVRGICWGGNAVVRRRIWGLGGMIMILHELLFSFLVGFKPKLLEKSVVYLFAKILD